MIDGSEKRNCQLGFELQNSHVCETRSTLSSVYVQLSNFCKKLTNLDL